MLRIIKLFLLSIFTLSSSICSAKENTMKVYDADKTLVVGTSGDFVPFEFLRNGELIGFDIDLIRAIAKKLGMDILIRDIQFYSLIPSLQNDYIQVVIAGMSYTPERAKQIDFSIPYYFNRCSMLVVGRYDKLDPIKPGMKIGVQTGSLMHQWIKKQKIDVEVVAMDNNTQLIEELKSNSLNGVLFDEVLSKILIEANPYLPLNLITLNGLDDHGIGIGVKKDSPLLDKINSAITALTESGELATLKLKWGL